MKNNAIDPGSSFHAPSLSLVLRAYAGPAFALSALLLHGPALAQGVRAQGSEPQGSGSAATVSWTASVANAATVKRGGAVALVLRGAVRDGWHVYALRQLPDGPTPLRVALDPNDVATLRGAPVGSPATIAHDAAFNLDTPYYTRNFTVTVPVRVKAHVAPGRQVIPVSVRFQTCNGQTCEPPKTLHLSVAVDVGADVGVGH